MNQEINQNITIESANKVRPWVRFWARMIDILFAAFTLGLIFLLSFPALNQLPSFILGIIIIFLWVFY